jgi:15-cis-phytoene synthase
VANSSEILFGQLKLAWWREAILSAPDNRPKGEPLLGRLVALSTHDINPELELLLTAWEEYLLAEGDAVAVTRFADHRGAAIFGGYIRLIGSNKDVRNLGAEWALADLKGVACSHPGAVPLPQQRVLRPLTILALSVRDVTGPRLVWHALTGR